MTLFCTLALIFSYPDANQLDSLSTDKKITLEQLKKWDDESNRLIEERKLKDGEPQRLETYLYNAQQEAAELGKGKGTLDPLSLKILRLFDHEFTVKVENDPFSDKLAELVFAKFEKRFEDEQTALKDSRIKEEGQGVWKGKKPFFGLKIASWKPWAISSACEFRAPVPPKYLGDEWKEQIRQVQLAMKDATPEQKELIYFWASQRGPGSGDWQVIADKYADEHQVPLEKRMEVRADLSKALADAHIAVFDTKYEYYAPRPHMAESAIHPVIEVPNHPSYPSAHSTLSGAAVEVLTHYYPEAKAYWEKTAQESGWSRLYAGIHYPMDHESGMQMGHSVGKAVIKNVKENK